MLGSLGLWEILLIILVIVVLFFGASKIPQLLRGVGEGIRDFKKATREPDQEAPSTEEPPSDKSLDNNA